MYLLALLWLLAGHLRGQQAAVQAAAAATPACEDLVVEE